LAHVVAGSRIELQAEAILGTPTLVASKDQPHDEKMMGEL
jgi:hypothetical protein